MFRFYLLRYWYCIIVMHKMRFVHEYGRIHKVACYKNIKVYYSIHSDKVEESWHSVLLKIISKKKPWESIL